VTFAVVENFHLLFCLNRGSCVEAALKVHDVITVFFFKCCLHNAIYFIDLFTSY